jgi:SHS2 domain-containing protein
VGRIEVFDHTADVGLRIFGADLDDLFQTAAEALFDYIIVNRAEVRPEHEESVDLRAESSPDLLIAWLNDLIFRSETEHRLYSRFRARVLEDGTRLVASIFGEPINRDRHILDHEVKAATHHGATLEQRPDGWVAELILDI